MENNLELKYTGLVCDKIGCDWEDMSIKMEDYEKYVNTSCPECGENILTEKDYKDITDLLKATEVVNSMTKEQMEEMVKNLSTEQMDQTLDKLNELGLKKTGENEDGTENWESKHDKHK